MSRPLPGLEHLWEQKNQFWLLRAGSGSDWYSADESLMHKPVSVEDSSAATGFVDDDRGDGHGTRGLVDHIAQVHRKATEVFQDKTTRRSYPGRPRWMRDWGTGGKVPRGP